MMKKILKTTISLGAALVLSACGGGDNPPPVEGSSIGTEESSVGTLPPETGTAYYVDAPVSGVHFSCGSQTGVTDSNGALTFEVGSGCTLTIGDLVLRSVEGGELHDGVFIFEDNLPVAQMLQTLDNDGNASNGITITDEMLAYLENNVSLPSDPGDLNVSELFDEINGSVPGYEGHYVDETEAQAHIEETRQSLDHTPPVITLNGDVDMTIAHDSNFTDPWVSVSDDYYSENEINITVSGSVDINTIGDYTLTYTAVDGAGNSASVTRIVHVTDQTAPVISLEGDSFTIEVGTTLTQADAISRVGATATDVVDGSVTVSANISQVETTVVGDYNIVLTAVDNAGNESTATVTVYVTDTTAPVITLNGNNPDTVEVAQGSSYSDPGVSVTDNSGEIITAVVSGTVNTTQIGSYTLTYTATDSSGNESNITRTVNVQDTTPPVIVLQGDADITVAYGSTFTDPGAIASDNSGETLTVTASGTVDTNTIGDYTLTYTVSDSSGNAAPAVTRTVHVTDQTAPVISLEGDSFTIEVGTTLTQADAISRVGATATDVVDGSVTVSANISQAETTVVGDYNIVLTAVDNAGNESTVTVIVHVTDTTAPVITLNGDNPDTVEVAQGSSYSDPGASVTDNSGETITPVVTGEVNTTQIGTYTLTYTATDSSGNESNVSRTVSVVDTTPPVVTPNGDNPMTVLVNENYVDAGASVTDNSGESLTATVVQSNTVDTTTTGTYEVVYVARDSSGNEGTATRTVTVINGQPPVITLLGDNPVYVEINTPFNDPGATANDFEDGDISAYISSNAATAVDVNTTGSYVVTYTVTDSSGNTVTAERNVTVEDTIAPVIVLNGDNPMTVSQDATFIDPGATVTDNSGETIDVNVTGSVDTAAVGTYTLTYYAQDSAGNAATPVTRTVNVVDVTPPVITVDPLEVTVEIGTVLTIDDALSGVSAVDAVDGSVSVDANVSGVDLNATGDYTIYYTAVDSAGNEAQATRTLHIVDTTPPVITLNGDNPMNLLVGDDYTEEGTTVTDNSGETLNATVISNDVNTSEAGVYSVVYHAVDSAGNEANATRVVNVTLGNPPVITLNGPNPYDVQLNTNYTDPGASADDPEDGAVSVDINASGVDMGTIGTYTVYFEATDSQGNTAYAQRTVNVVENTNLTAYPDNVQPADIAQQTLDVTANDYVPSGSSITNVYLKVWNSQTGEYLYTDSFTFPGQGSWSVIGTDVEFTPESTFGGGTVAIDYQIVDDQNNTSESTVAIEYPVVLDAVYDEAMPTDIASVTLSVLGNDTFNEVTQVSVWLVDYDQNGQQIFVTDVNRPEGNWTVSGQDIIFTPVDGYGGGGVWIEYAIEENGRRSTDGIWINYPVFVKAYYDHVDMNETAAVTYDVTQNDTYDGNATVTVQLVDYSTQTPQYVSNLSDSAGDWVVESNNSITFMPNGNFDGGIAHVEYVLGDNNGHFSQAGFDIQYPVALQANYDRVEGLNDIVAVNVDVLANDTLPGDYSSVTLLVQGNWDYQTQQNTYVTSYTDNRGTWKVETNQTVTFEPSSTFGGGSVWWNYKIFDVNGHESETGVELVYPLYVAAQFDEYTTDTVQTVTYNVLSNDQVGDGITAEILFVDYSNGGVYVSTLNDNVGTWSVNGNSEVVFEPNSNFGGGDVHVEYVITDNDGHYSQTGFTIHYPVGPTPVCTVTTLSTIDEVYNAVTNDLSFTLENGEKEFEAEIDDYAYVIDPDLYSSSTAVSGINPMYMVRYREHTWTTPSNDIFVEAEMSATEVDLNSSDNTLYYSDNQSGNDRGYKYVVSEGAGGDYTVETDGSNTLSITGEGAVFSFKVVRDITTSEINNILENAGISLTLDTSDTAQMQLTKGLQSYYDWWGPFDQEIYEDFDAFITAFSYDSSAGDAYGNELVHNNAGWEKGILFAAGSAGNTNGTLVEVYRQDNTLLVSNAGTWQIRTIDDPENGQYSILDVRPTLCGYENKIFRLDGTTIMQGQINEEANVVGAELAFSESLKNKLQQFFIDNAPLDIDPTHATNPEITEAMIDGKIFYTAETLSDGSKAFKELTVDTQNWSIAKRDILVDSNGQVVSDLTEDLGFELDKGRIRIYEGDVKIGLNSDPGSGDWDVTIYTWDGIDTELWMLTEPSDFPN